jgi:hypothetical protein
MIKGKTLFGLADLTKQVCNQKNLTSKEIIVMSRLRFLLANWVFVMFEMSVSKLKANG